MALENKYERIITQLTDLFIKTDNIQSRLSTIVAVLHHKFDDFYWTGYYMLNSKNELLVSTYQGPLACLKLEKNIGVCWAGINQKQSLNVPDVDKFSGHIACSSLSKSEIVIPLFDKSNKIVGVLDIDSKDVNSFSEIDLKYLEKINRLVFA